MTTMTIRKLPESVRRRLRLRAARHGRSVEAEVRQILTDAVSGDEPTDWERALERAQAEIRALYGGSIPTGLVDDFIAERHAEAARELEVEGDR